MKTAKLLLVGLVPVLLAVWWGATPTLDAEAWSPAEAPPFAGATAANTALQAAVLLGPGQLHGPEDIAIDADGRVHAACMTAASCALTAMPWSRWPTPAAGRSA